MAAADRRPTRSGLWRERLDRSACKAARGLTLRSKGTDAMAKQLDVGDNTAQDRDRHAARQSGDKHNQQKPRGKAFQVNENTVGDQEPGRSPAPPSRGSGDKRNEQKLQGKAFEVNENSVEDEGTARLP